MGLALSDVETEQLRDMRARLNRVPKGALGDKSIGPLSKGFFDLCTRLRLTATPGKAVLADIAAQITEADEAGLAAAVGALQALRQADDAKTWRAVFDAGLLQAVLTRRLVLGGRERL